MLNTLDKTNLYAFFGQVENTESGNGNGNGNGNSEKIVRSKSIYCQTRCKYRVDGNSMQVCW